MDNVSTATLKDDYLRVRGQSLEISSTLAAEDTVVQSMPDVSPTKWHLAHVTWFFERMVLEEFSPGYRRYDENFDFLFNSYYYSVGQMHARPRRGLLSRPTLAEVVAYRSHVDEAMQSLLESGNDRQVCERVVLGLNHEQQHQELMLTDIKHVFSCNPLRPAVRSDLQPPAAVPAPAYAYMRGASGT
ncbi:MAG: DinB family protein, partial [Gammaproteobacteria bacterium]|nr:DinB family protein [Gammaproteobacteria bacterium]